MAVKVDQVGFVAIDVHYPSNGGNGIIQITAIPGGKLQVQSQARWVVLPSDDLLYALPTLIDRNDLLEFCKAYLANEESKDADGNSEPLLSNARWATQHEEETLKRAILRKR